ncbi:MAG: zf-HC2 domain-containing protein [Peptostreptococcaceae bacterium]
MNKISCDTCMDLIPLVKDEVASEDSYKAVMEHVEECESCKVILLSNQIKKESMDDKKVISKIKKQLLMLATILVIAGSIIGIGISESEAMFYNILIMPIIGGLGYYILKNKSYLLSVIIFLAVYVYHLIKYIIEGLFNEASIMSLLVAPSLWSFIYSGLCLLGTLIGFLLYIAFKKENE